MPGYAAQPHPEATQLVALHNLVVTDFGLGDDLQVVPQQQAPQEHVRFLDRQEGAGAAVVTFSKGQHLGLHAARQAAARAEWLRALAQ